MATSQVHFSELKAGHWIETVQMRLLRFWEAHNVKKARRSSKPLSMTTILTHLSSEGSLYDLSAFDVARSNPKFRFGHTPVTISFESCSHYVNLSLSHQYEFSNIMCIFFCK
ncbi:hypothetical protein Bca101_033982 [Brassica carinata]